MKNSTTYSILVFFITVLCAGCSSAIKEPILSIKQKYARYAKASYHGDTYTVNTNDTLYFISYRTGVSVSKLIKLNRIKKPYTIYPNQELTLVDQQTNDSKQITPINTDGSVQQPTTIHATTKIENKSDALVGSSEFTSKPNFFSKKLEVDHKNGYVMPSQTDNDPSAKDQNLVKDRHWMWPAKGKIITPFTPGNDVSKGINIAGRRGQIIFAASNGKVVFVSNSLYGYGHVIIIQHNNEYLSAYTYNQDVLVKEGQIVTTGQPIAKMGRADRKQAMLHFEIRYQGQSVDPLKYLPK